MHKNLLSNARRAVVAIADLRDTSPTTRKRRAASRCGAPRGGESIERREPADSRSPFGDGCPASVADGRRALSRRRWSSGREARPFSRKTCPPARWVVRPPASAGGRRAPGTRLLPFGRGRTLRPGRVEDRQAARRTEPLVRRGSLRGGGAGRAVKRTVRARRRQERPAASSYRGLAAPKASGAPLLWGAHAGDGDIGPHPTPYSLAQPSRRQQQYFAGLYFPAC